MFFHFLIIICVMVFVFNIHLDLMEAIIQCGDSYALIFFPRAILDGRLNLLFKFPQTLSPVFRVFTLKNEMLEHRKFFFINTKNK